MLDFDTVRMVVLNKELVLKKQGFADLVYHEGTLLKVLMDSNEHIVVKDDQERTFILNNQDQKDLWDFL